MRRPTHETCAALAAAIDRYIEKTDDSLGALLKRAGYVRVDRTLEETKALEDKLGDILSRYTASFVKSVQARGGYDIVGIVSAFADSNPETTFADRSAFISELCIAFRDAFMDLMPVLVRAYSAKIDDQLAITGITKRTTGFIDGWSQELAQLMKLNTDADIRGVLNRALRDGKSVESVTREIIDHGIRGTSSNKSNPLRTDWRARRVALTEMLRAHSYAQLDAYTQNPAVNAKMWRHTHAKFSAARPNHLAMDGVTVPVNDSFALTGRDGSVYHPQCPRDTCLPASEAVNCHCLIQPVVDKDIIGMPLEERDRLWREAVDADDRAWEAELDARNRLEALRYRGEDTAEAEADLAAMRSARHRFAWRQAVNG